MKTTVIRQMRAMVLLYRAPFKSKERLDPSSDAQCRAAGEMEAAKSKCA